MLKFTDSLKFKYPWRSEQARVLANLDEYIDDKRIHIVAAPGAGKTVMGLEIFNRYALKTLAISPTLVVQNQWLERLKDFVEDSTIPTWASTTLEEPKHFTSTTYQGLFAFDKRLAEEDSTSQYKTLAHWFKENKIGMLILDEAHHLKAAWWRVLMEMIESSEALIVVSLTATPPYDASVLEWSRYQKLCGEVDEEISIPELVRSNSLAPHQDYIWMVKTDSQNIHSFHCYQANLNQFVESLYEHKELQYLLSLHHWLNENYEIKNHELLINLDECFALLGLLKYHKQTIPLHILNLLNIEESDIEPISVYGWEKLLQSFLEGSHYPKAKPVQRFQETFKTFLESKHLLRYGKVSLDNSQKKLKAFNKTQERIRACFEIAQLEYKYRASWTRLVILADYIRDEKFQLSIDGLEEPAGAYPIFHYFIHHLDEKLSKGVVLLTGRLTIMNEALIEPLADLLPLHVKLEYELFNSAKLSKQMKYVVVKTNSSHLVSAFTKLHKEGKVSTLIGTRSLLGEGWDAPHVNALILATQTGAYVTTNQIRGRAIRIDTNDELKTASIWHIVAMSPEMGTNELILADLHKRFKTFAGIHANELTIESGIERLKLNIDEEALKDDEVDMIEHSNRIMEKRLQDDIFNLKERWTNALEEVKEHRFKSGLQFSTQNSKTMYNFSKYVTKARSRIGFVVYVWFASLLHVLKKIFMSNDENLKNIVNPNDNHLQKIANIVFYTLSELELFHHKEREDYAVRIEELEEGYFRFSLEGATKRDNELFLETLSQLFEPIERPKYIIVVHFLGQYELFSVPHRLGINRASAEVYFKLWRKFFVEFKKIELLSTHKALGREYLLKAKAKYYQEAKEKHISVIERWE